MFVDDESPHPLPEDPVLAEVAVALRDNGDWAVVLDK
jgi:hypothetical protein